MDKLNKRIVLPYCLHFGVFKILYKLGYKRLAIKWAEKFD